MNEIRIEHLSKQYGEHIVLRDLNLLIPAGTSVCVIGPSGCGKTTLLRMLMRLEQPSSGSIKGLPDRISPVFQEDRLCEIMTALANVRLTAGSADERCADILKELGLTDALQRRTSELSGGMKRRVSVARALAHPSDLLLMDEPFSGLDDKTAEITAAVIRKYAAGRTLIYTAHEDAQAIIGGIVINLKTITE